MVFLQSKILSIKKEFLKQLEMDEIKHLLYDYLISVGLNETTASYLNMIALLLALLIVVFISDFIIRKLLIKAFSQYALQSKTNFDDFLISNKVPRNIAHIIPLLLAIKLAPFIFFDFPDMESIIEKGLEVFAIVVTLWMLEAS